MYNYEECSACQQKMRNFKIKRVQAQKRQFILMMTMLLIVFGYLIWQVNRNIEREPEVVTVYKPIFTEVSTTKKLGDVSNSGLKGKIVSIEEEVIQIEEANRN